MVRQVTTAFHRIVLLFAIACLSMATATLAQYSAVYDECIHPFEYSQSGGSCGPPGVSCDSWSDPNDPFSYGCQSDTGVLNGSQCAGVASTPCVSADDQLMMVHFTEMSCVGDEESCSCETISTIDVGEQYVSDCTN